MALVVMLGPAAVDMYLSSMPKMARELGASYAGIQISLTVFLSAMGAGQLLCGPITDSFGRRRPLLIGILGFVVASIWSSQGASFPQLLCSRMLQGLCAAMTLVVVLSMVRDLASGNAAARLFALLMTIQGLAPVVAPALGGFVETRHGWRGVMLVLAGLGGLAWLGALSTLSETLAVRARAPWKPGGILRGYVGIALSPGFRRPALALSAAFFLLFTYIGGAPLVYQATFGLSPEVFGIVVGATGLALLLGAIASARLVEHHGVARLSLCGAVLMCCGCSLAWLSMLVSAGLAGIVAGISVAMFGLGVAEATLVSMAMSSQRVALGSTAALLGAMQLVLASGATPLAGSLAALGAGPWLSFLAAFSLVVLGLVARSVRQARAHAPSEGPDGSSIAD